MRYIIAALSLISTVISAPAPENHVSAFFAPRNLTTIKIKDSLFGIRNVDYWITSQGQAIIDGSIVYGSEQELLSKQVSASSKDTRAFDVFAGAQSWPNGEIKYRFVDGSAQSQLDTEVTATINRWLTVAPWLTFTKLTPSDAFTPGTLTITHNDCSGCVASFGYDKNSARTMNLPWPNSACPNAGYCGDNEIAKLFGYAQQTSTNAPTAKPT
ncbi:uncharacterized protein KY384_004638 [Bacidia gigantensis]|uniref:uncharacterized protein n=1 Tax=Bacidia gigantensis TaxID=2732470 RepID=UPI001D045249|nr:uncharacterized protein KY384_004638 [Bacidia gigantensis]KAG8530600.1 hypothetical protein KY384_004638 [Bacidia gigantensis]